MRLGKVSFLLLKIKLSDWNPFRTNSFSQNTGGDNSTSNVHQTTWLILSDCCELIELENKSVDMGRNGVLAIIAEKLRRQNSIFHLHRDDEWSYSLLKKQ
jgi:prophage antirepressor-like protein